MNFKHLLLVALSLTLTMCKGTTEKKRNAAMVLEEDYGVISRTIPGIEQQFIFEELPAVGDKDVFEFFLYSIS